MKKIPSRLDTIAKQISSSELFESTAEFILKFGEFVKTHKTAKTKDNGLDEWLSVFLTSVEFYVTLKDRVIERVEKQFDKKVKSSTQRDGKIHLVLDLGTKKSQSIWVEIKETKVVYGIGNMEVGEIEELPDPKENKDKA